VETPVLIIRETFPDVTSAYYFPLDFPYHVGSLLSLIYLNLFFSFLFSLPRKDDAIMLGVACRLHISILPSATSLACHSIPSIRQHI
jgi:hypothetical protein